MAVTNYMSVNGQILSETTNGETTLYGTDALGNVVNTANHKCEVLNTYVYKPYSGEVWVKTGSSPDPKFLWVGSHGYRQTGLHYKFLSAYVRSRHYQGPTASWTSRDALWPSEMPYGYVENRVMTGVDYWGLWCGSTDGDRSVRNQFNQAINSVASDPNFEAFLFCLSDPQGTHIPICNKRVSGSEETAIGSLLRDWFGMTGTKDRGGCMPDVKIIQDKGGIFTKCKGESDCAVTKYLSGGRIEIYVCENAWRFKRCGDLKCTLAHELIHAMGRDHRTDRGVPPGMITPFECIKFLDGKGCKGATATRLGPG